MNPEHRANVAQYRLAILASTAECIKVAEQAGQYLDRAQASRERQAERNQR